MHIKYSYYIILLLPFVFVGTGCLTTKVINRLDDPYVPAQNRLVKIESAKTNGIGDLCIVLQGQQENEKTPTYFKIECNMDSVRKNNPHDTLTCPYSPSSKQEAKTGIYTYRHIVPLNLYVMYIERDFAKIADKASVCTNYPIDIMDNMQSEALDINWTYIDISDKCLQVTYRPIDAGYNSVTFVIPPGKRFILWPFIALPFAVLLDVALLPFEIIGIFVQIKNKGGLYHN
jgi:hypothetical protein